MLEVFMRALPVEPNGSSTEGQEKFLVVDPPLKNPTEFENFLAETATANSELPASSNTTVAVNQCQIRRPNSQNMKESR
jgi:hypothetical protein